MRIGTAFLALIALAASAAGEERGSTQALGLLLGLANETMNTRECKKTKLDGTPYRFKDDLATYFSEFSKGTNRITGECRRGACSVEISHQNGEDVFSARYRFKLSQKGTVILSSLECAWTP